MLRDAFTQPQSPNLTRDDLLELLQ